MIFDKEDLKKYFLNDNQSGFKTKEKHIIKTFNGLNHEIDNWHVKYFNDENFIFSQKLYNFLYEIVKIPVCLTCNKKIEWRKVFSEGYKLYCNKRCSGVGIERLNKIMNTNFNKYGHSSVFLNDKIKNKINKTNLEKYGDTIPIKTKKIKDKIVKNNLKKYGVENSSQLEYIKQKIKNTNIEKYGVDSVMKNDQIKNKNINSRINNNLEKFKKKIKEENYYLLSINNDTLKLIDPNGNEFTENREFLYQRMRNGIELSTNILPYNNSNKSNYEIEILKFLNDSGIVNVSIKNKEILNGKEIDIYLPDYKLGIEFNGLYWHSELFVNNTYHLDKYDGANKKNIDLIQIFEDEWNEKKEIVKSRILARLGIFKKKIFARNTIIKIVDNLETKQFLIDNHLQGTINSLYKYGLYYDDELISIMTFGKLRRSLGKKNNDEFSFEMLRFCNKINVKIIGGASKLLKHFIDDVKPKTIISFCDKRYFNGEIYLKLGFNHICDTKINYWYIIGKKRSHRFQFRKDVLIKNGFDPSKTEHQIMLERKYYRIYDCGNKKYEMIL